MQALEELLNCYFVVNKRISYALSMQNKKIISYRSWVAKLDQNMGKK